MHKLTDWTVRRSGPSLTVTGKGETGRTVKVAGIDAIVVEGGKVIATEGPNRAAQAGRAGEPVRLHLIVG